MKKGNGTSPPKKQLPRKQPEHVALVQEELSALQSAIAQETVLRAQLESNSLRRDNIFLKIGLRTGIKNIAEWSIDLSKGICMPPDPEGPKNSKALEPQEEAQPIG